ncbi:T9SS-dependent M36 family metallopeptidase [Hymenobacter sp. YC55]|uniref:T9SS-dependent M36 family metallopeptidase n=1 Tax=Hymenobacter sp. YC55 TaxID=3034019 RepID=UPI0023F81BAF|nr:T9SS-dependent M36 family metallopeptidase [Hymenobacter sp. YC55]MDF7813181.1 T9SS-dependent M36 family metallopeptidase [Hymenobacter sp. YC55]
MKTSFTPSNCRPLLLAAMLALPGLAAAQSTPLRTALQQLSSRSTKLGLSATDVADPAVTSSYTDEGSAITHVYLRQRYQGIEIFGAEADMHLDRNEKVVSMNTAFLPNVNSLARAAATEPSLTPVQAVAAAASALNLPAPGNLTLTKAGAPAVGMVFNEGGISLDPISVKLMYQARPSGELVLVWDVTIAPKSGDHYWNARVDASTGQLVDKTDYTISEPLGFVELTQRALATPTWPETQPGAAATPNSYNAYPLTVESPLYGARQLQINPADPTYSPYGWHDTNGAAGPEFTITRGNNVHAYEDRAARNGNPVGYSPDGGTDLSFDFPFNQTDAPQVYQDAAITNLFVWNNLMHDVMAYKGFNEVSGNFQVKNYTDTGLGNDDVRAEAQDGGGTNNANFSTPVDGARPRMQMYLWPGGTGSIVSPATIAGSLPMRGTAYGRTLTAAGPISGKVVLANDGSANPPRSCNPLLNAADINGNIALVYRGGTCSTPTKIRNAQNAGARLVIIADSIPNTAIANYGGATDTVGLRIPSVAISKADGDKIRGVLTSGTVVTISVSGITRDGDFDNGVIAHEYGHGISNRLTGGPANSNCLGNAEQMGEGWSDFFGLWMTTKPGDQGFTPRGIGNYVTGAPTDGYGIRPQRYSTDFAVNNQTYANIGVAPYTAVHAIGSVWAATLWDLNWKLVEKYGYNRNLKAATGGNNIALKLVLDGLKLQVCRPGFLDGRDAILRADSIYNNKANTYLIWQVFARRGMGIDAVQGSSNILTDQVAGYLIPTRVLATQSQQQRDELVEVYPNPASSELTVRLPVSSKTPVQVSLLTVLGKTVQTTAVPSGQLQQGARLNTSDVANGLYIVQLRSSAGTFTKRVVIQH